MLWSKHKRVLIILVAVSLIDGSAKATDVTVEDGISYRLMMFDEQENPKSSTE
ncbi:MAG: hypothetical protein QGG71_22360 [Pirellulaceae bacterium]|nr:hypothetical protein [Pirellulaceae bacterium]